MYITDVSIDRDAPARRFCVASCTTADAANQLLVPHPRVWHAHAGAHSGRPCFSLSHGVAPHAAASVWAARKRAGSLACAPAVPRSAAPAPRPPHPRSQADGDGPELRSLLSPALLLPWVRRPEQLFGHWLRLEAYAIAPVAEKLLDAFVFLGLLEDADDPPPAPKAAKLNVSGGVAGWGTRG